MEAILKLQTENLEIKDWYQYLVEECKAIITEAVFTSRWSLVEGYHALGERIVTENNLDRKEVYGKKILQDLGKSIGISKSSLYYAIQFYDKYPQLDRVPEGKNITWNKIITKYLPNNNNDVHFSSESNEWYTPKEILERTIKVFGEIDLDPCSNRDTPNVPALHIFDEQDNGLEKDWFGRVFMNPPYGNEIKDWINKVSGEYEKGNLDEAIVLAPSRTDTEWFRRLKKFPRCFIFGRLKFGDSNNSAPFPSMIVYMGTQRDLFIKVFREIGDIYEIV